jgi:hypothetical protein
MKFTYKNKREVSPQNDALMHFRLKIMSVTWDKEVIAGERMEIDVFCILLCA